MAQWVCYNNDKVVVEFCDSEARSKATLPDHLHWGSVTTEIPILKQNRKYTYDPESKSCTDVEPVITSDLADGIKEDVTAENLGTFKA